MTKTCKTCGTEKFEGNFPSDGHGGTRPHCKNCFNASRRKNSQINRLIDELATPKVWAPVVTTHPVTDGVFTVGLNILVIPDTQVKPGVPTDHIEWLSRWIAHKRPDVIVMLGDWFDMPSLSSWDEGKKSAEGRRVSADIKSGTEAIRLLMSRWSLDKSYRPRLVFCEGNHEARATRYMEENPQIDTIPLPNEVFADLGWEVYPFLKPVTINGVTFVHYSQLNAQGKVMGSGRGQPSAKAQAQREHRSIICGHQQGYDSAILEAPNGRIRSFIVGSFYMHSENYLGPQGNSHWHGCLLLNDTHNGDFDLCEVSLRYLRRKYG